MKFKINFNTKILAATILESSRAAEDADLPSQFFIIVLKKLLGGRSKLRAIALGRVVLPSPK